MARFDKYDPFSGGFRAPLAADLVATSKTGNGNPLAVGLDVNGRIVPGAGNTGIKGLLVTTQDKKAGDILDVMTAGEIVEMAAVTAGTNITAADAGGAVATTAPGAGRKRVGYTVEATRLIVRVSSEVSGT